MCRALKCGMHRVFIAINPFEGDIARRRIPDLRRVRGQRSGHGGHGGKYLNIQHHGFGGISSLGSTFGHHKRHGLTGMSDFFIGQNRLGRGSHRHAILAGKGDRRRDVSQPSGFQVCAGEHSEHTGHRQCGRPIDTAQFPMPDRRTHKRAISLTRKIDVIDKPPRPRQKRRVLAAQGIFVTAKASGKLVHGRISSSCLTVPGVLAPES